MFKKNSKNKNNSPPLDKDMSFLANMNSLCDKKGDDVYPYLPTLPVFLGVSKFFIKSPGLPVRAPNLPDKMDF